jgi:beta-N-acetylhexosaminidase
MISRINPDKIFLSLILFLIPLALFLLNFKTSSFINLPAQLKPLPPSFSKNTFLPDFIKNLSFDQKVGQLFIVGFEGKEINPQLEAFLKIIKPGGVLLLARNIENENQLKKLIKDLQQISLKDSGLPLLVAVDQEGGPVCRLPFVNCYAQKNISHPKAAYMVGFLRGFSLKGLGVNLNLAPLVDEAKKGDFIFERTFQKSKELNGILAKNLIFGQKEAGILSCLKHFPGYGFINFDPERNMLASYKNLPSISSFSEALKAEPEMLMVANAIYEEIDKENPFSFSPKAISFLKNNLGTNFLLIADDLATPVLKKRYSPQELALKPFEAGVDLMIVSGFDSLQDVLNIVSAFKSKIQSDENLKNILEQRLLKILELKKKIAP